MIARFQKVLSTVLSPGIGSEVGRKRTPHFGSITSLSGGKVGELDRVHAVGVGVCTIVGIGIGVTGGIIVKEITDPDNSNCGPLNADCEDNATCDKNDWCEDNADCMDNDECDENGRCHNNNSCNNSWPWENNSCKDNQSCTDNELCSSNDVCHDLDNCTQGKEVKA